MLATFAQKRNFMMTREEILSIEEYCAEHKVSHKKRLEELDIPFWHFYKAKKKYREEDEQEGQSGQFIQLYLADMSLRQCLRLVLPVDPANHASRLRKRTRAILP